MVIERLDTGGQWCRNRKYVNGKQWLTKDSVEECIVFCVNLEARFWMYRSVMMHTNCACCEDYSDWIQAPYGVEVYQRVSSKIS